MSENRELKIKVLLDAVDRITRPLRGVAAASQRSTREVRDLHSKLKELNEAQKKIDGYRATGAAIGATQKKLAQAEDQLKRLHEEFAATKKPTAAMQRELKKAEEAVSHLKNEHSRLIDKSKQLRSELDKSGIKTKKLAETQRELKSQAANTTAALQKQQTELKRLNEIQQRLNNSKRTYAKSMELRDKAASAGMGMAATGAATGAALAIPVKSYAEAEDAATQLRVALMNQHNKVGADFERLNQLANELGNTLPGTTADFQNMLTMLKRQGMSSTTILGGLGKATAYLGVQLKMPMDMAAEFAAKLQDATKTTEKDMMGLMDTIQRTFYLGVDQNNMLQAFAKLSPAMDTIKQKGLEGAKALAPLVVMADQAGMAGEAAGNAYRKVFQYSLDIKKVSEANEALASKGIKLDFSDGKGEFGGMDKMFAQLDKLKTLNTQDRLSAVKKLFGDDAETLQVVSLLIDKGKSGYLEVQQKMANQAELQSRVNLQLGTLKNLWDAATGTFTNAMVAFGEAIAPELKAIVTWLGNMSLALGNWSKANPVLSNLIMKTIAFVAIFMTVLGGLSLALAAILGPMALLSLSLKVLGINMLSGVGILGKLGTAIKWLGGLVWRVGVAMLANPIGLAISAIALSVFLIYQYWEPIKSFFGGLWSQVTSAFNGGIWGISKLLVNWSPIGLFYKAWAGVLSWFGVSLPSNFTAFGRMIIDGLINGLSSRWEAVKAKASEIANSITSTVKGALGIHSPSRVFAALGGHTMDGLAQGLINHQAGPLAAVIDTAKKMAAAGAGVSIAMGAGFANAEPPKSLANRAPMSAMASQPSNITIQIYQQPGQSAQELALLVQQAIDDHERKKARMARSSMGDKA